MVVNRKTHKDPIIRVASCVMRGNSHVAERPSLVVGFLCREKSCRGPIALVVAKRIKNIKMIIVFFGFVVLVFVIGLWAMVFRALRLQERLSKEVYEAIAAAKKLSPAEREVEITRIQKIVSNVADMAKREELREAVRALSR